MSKPTKSQSAATTTLTLTEAASTFDAAYASAAAQAAEKAEIEKTAERTARADVRRVVRDESRHGRSKHASARLASAGVFAVAIKLAKTAS